MKSIRYILAASALLFAAVFSRAASPAVFVQVIQNEKEDEYLGLLAKANARIKALTGIDQLRHAWTGDFAGEDSHGLVVVSTYESAAAAAAIQEKLLKDPETQGILKEFSAIRKLGPAWLHKAVRWEGLYPNGAVYNTSISTKDEAEYMKALDGLKGILDANGFKDAKLNLLRVVAGRDANATHLVVICFPNQARVLELVDAISDTAMMKDWNVGAAKIRTVAHNGTYHEVTK